MKTWFIAAKDRNGNIKTFFCFFFVCFYIFCPDMNFSLVDASWLKAFLVIFFFFLSFICLLLMLCQWKFCKLLQFDLKLMILQFQSTVVIIIIQDFSHGQFFSCNFEGKVRLWVDFMPSCNRMRHTVLNTHSSCEPPDVRLAVWFLFCFVFTLNLIILIRS